MSRLTVFVYRYIYQLRCQADRRHRRTVEYGKAHYAEGDTLVIRCAKCGAFRPHDVLSFRVAKIEEDRARKRIAGQVACRALLRARLKREQEEVPA